MQRNPHLDWPEEGPQAQSIRNYMIEQFSEINSIVGVVLAAMIAALAKVWVATSRIRAAAEHAKKDAQERAERESERQQQAWHKEIIDQVHLWRNKFQVMENKLELVRSEREVLTQRLNNLQNRIDTQQRDITARDMKITDLQTQVAELERRLQKYEPENRG